jgi:Protein of unknown function (DUF1091)
MSFEKELLGIKAMITINIRKPSAGSYDRELMKTTMDVCRLRNGVTGNFLAKLMYETIKDHSNYKFECPLKKDDYFIRNFQAPINILPMRLFSEIIQGEKIFNVSISVKTRIAKVKVLADLFAVNFYGSLVFK